MCPAHGIRSPFNRKVFLLYSRHTVVRCGWNRLHSNPVVMRARDVIHDVAVTMVKCQLRDNRFMIKTHTHPHTCAHITHTRETLQLWYQKSAFMQHPSLLHLTAGENISRINKNKTENFSNFHFHFQFIILQRIKT